MKRDHLIVLLELLSVLADEISSRNNSADLSAFNAKVDALKTELTPEIEPALTEKD